jgi:ABC-type uncharacterized transport system substrate-binding protein
MQRRDLLRFLGGSAVAWPFLARAQPSSKIYRLGYLAPAPIPHLIDALVTKLREFGYIEGKNIKIEYRYGATETLDALAAELVELHPDAIVTVATPPALAAKRATKTIPIVMATAGDPVRLGVVSSYARPGGNITGVTLYSTELTAKRLELFTEAVSGLKRIAFLANGKNIYNIFLWEETEPAARALGLEPHLFNMQEPGDLARIFMEMERKGANALVVLSDALFNSLRRQIVAQATEHRLPAMYEAREFVEDGGLISYGPDIAEMTRRSATFVDKVLKGINPADLPIEQPTRFELIVNLAAAKAIGATISTAVLLRADKIIE